MGYYKLFLLGKLAAAARTAGLGSLINLSRDIADYLLLNQIKGKYLPLKTKINDLTLYGFFRHRSFLAHLDHGYELALRRFFLKSLSPGVVLVDGGAHIGFYTLLAAQRIGQRGQIFAFEPDPFNFAALTLNLKKNNKNFVWAFRKALASNQGVATFYSSPGTIGSSLIKRSDIGPISAIKVETTTIDNILHNIDLRKLVIKLDIEGGEPFAIQGMKFSVKRAKEVHLFMEINPAALQQGGWTSKEVLQLLSTMGFELFFIDEKQNKLLKINFLDAKDIPKGNIYGIKK